MKVDTKIKSWKFLHDESEGYHAADGSSTATELRNSLEALEKRLVELPALIKKYKDIIDRKEADIKHLNGLSNWKKKKWEKENGRNAGEVVYQLGKDVDVYEGKIASAEAEQKRLPNRINDIKTQIKTLVEAEGKGIEKGIDPEAAKQLGEIEVAKQQEALEHQKLMQQKQADQQKEKDQQKKEEKAESEAKAAMQKWIIGGVVTLLLIVGAILAYKHFKAKKLTAA